jgi:hypothetical protein
MTTQERLGDLPHLNGRHQHTYETIFRHPAAHNLEWHDVRSLLAAMGDVSDEDNGSLQVRRNGQMAIFQVPKHKDVASVQELLEIRRFLQKSNESVSPVTGTPGIDLTVVIDHHEAKIYRTEFHETVPRRLIPYDPHGFGRHLHSECEEADGQRRTERNSFYDAITATLQGADRILIIGSGPGESSAMVKLLTHLKHNHPDVSNRVVGSILVDGHHQPQDQFLARAREFFALNGL